MFGTGPGMTLQSEPPPLLIDSRRHSPPDNLPHRRLTPASHRPTDPFMEWTSEGLILGVRRHGESSVILEAMTPDRGRHLGLVRGGRSRRQQPVLQPGNSVRLAWRARLEEHLGNFAIEPLTLRAGMLMQSAVGLHGLETIAAHLRLLPERDPHPRLHEAALVVLDNLADPVAAGALVVRFELALLDELGFGLDLAACAATGTRADLVYVSPKSGRAVSRDAGAPYRARLLTLPPFLRGGPEAPSAADVAAGLRLTGTFLERHVVAPRRLALPLGRSQLAERIQARSATESADAAAE